MMTQGTLIAAPSYRFAFQDHVPMTEVREVLRLAILAAESMHGRFRVIRDLDVECEFRRHEVIVGGGSEVGRDVADIFGGYVSSRFGDDAFTVTREAPGPPGRPGPPPGHLTP